MTTDRPPPAPPNPILLGSIYFLIILAMGFVLGVARNLILLRYFEPFAAVFLELLLILPFAWIVCGRLLAHRPLSPAGAAVMGAVALALLLTGEALLSLAIGHTLASHFALYAKPDHLLGLAGMVACAFIPVLRSRPFSITRIRG